MEFIYSGIIISEGNKMKDILLRLENKEIGICNSLNEVEVQISDCERRKMYLKGQLYEVQDIYKKIKEEK